MKRGIWSGQIASHSDRNEISDTTRLPQPRKRAPPMRSRLIAVAWPHDMIRRELSSNHSCQMQGRPTGYFLSENVHVCEIFQKSRTRERARSGSARIGPFRAVSDGKSVRARVTRSLQ